MAKWCNGVIMNRRREFEEEEAALLGEFVIQDPDTLSEGETHRGGDHNVAALILLVVTKVAPSHFAFLENFRLFSSLAFYFPIFSSTLILLLPHPHSFFACLECFDLLILLIITQDTTETGKARRYDIYIQEGRFRLKGDGRKYPTLYHLLQGNSALVRRQSWTYPRYHTIAVCEMSASRVQVHEYMILVHFTC